MLWQHVRDTCPERDLGSASCHPSVAGSQEEKPVSPGEHSASRIWCNKSLEDREKAEHVLSDCGHVATRPVGPDAPILPGGSEQLDSPAAPAPTPCSDFTPVGRLSAVSTETAQDGRCPLTWLMEVTVTAGHGEGREESSEPCGNGGMRAPTMTEGFGDRAWGRTHHVQTFHSATERLRPCSLQQGAEMWSPGKEASGHAQASPGPHGRLRRRKPCFTFSPAP